MHAAMTVLCVTGGGAKGARGSATVSCPPLAGAVSEVELAALPCSSTPARRYVGSLVHFGEQSCVVSRVSLKRRPNRLRCLPRGSVATGPSSLARDRKHQEG